VYRKPDQDSEVWYSWSAVIQTLEDNRTILPTVKYLKPLFHNLLAPLPYDISHDGRRRGRGWWSNFSFKHFIFTLL